MRTRTICFAGHKGGTSRSTSAVNLAGCWGAQGNRACLVDLDWQCSASRWCGIEDGGDVLLHAMEGRGDLQWRESSIPGVDIVPASPRLSTIDKHAEASATNLRDAIKRLPPKWQIIILDTPPHLGMCSLSGLVAATEAIVPFEPTPLAMAGLRDIMDTITEVKGRWSPTLKVSLVACRVPRTRLAAEVIQAVREEYGDILLEQQIRANVRVAESPSHEQCIITYDPHSHGAADYEALAQALMRHAPVSN